MAKLTTSPGHSPVIAAYIYNKLALIICYIHHSPVVTSWHMRVSSMILTRKFAGSSSVFPLISRLTLRVSCIAPSSTDTTVLSKPWTKWRQYRSYHVKGHQKVLYGFHCCNSRWSTGTHNSHMCVPLQNHNAGCNFKLTYILSCTHCHLVSPER